MYKGDGSLELGQASCFGVGGVLGACDNNPAIPRSDARLNGGMLIVVFFIEFAHEKWYLNYINMNMNIEHKCYKKPVARTVKKRL